MHSWLPGKLVVLLLLCNIWHKFVCLPTLVSDSQNGKFSYGYASSPGKRSSMEDFYETRIDAVGGEVVGLFGVFDGQYYEFRLLHVIKAML